MSCPHIVQLCYFEQKLNAKNQVATNILNTINPTNSSDDLRDFHNIMWLCWILLLKKTLWVTTSEISITSCDWSDLPCRGCVKSDFSHIISQGPKQILWVLWGLRTLGIPSGQWGCNFVRVPMPSPYGNAPPKKKKKNLWVMRLH